MQNVLDSLVPALLADKNRKFIYVEQASFLLFLFSGYADTSITSSYEFFLSTARNELWRPEF